MTDRDLTEQANELYERYAKPLEREHWGEFVAVTEDGTVTLGPDLVRLANEAERQHRKRSFIFKIGERAVGSIR